MSGPLWPPVTLGHSASHLVLSLPDLTLRRHALVPGRQTGMLAGLGARQVVDLTKGQNSSVPAQRSAIEQTLVGPLPAPGLGRLGEA